MNAWKIFTIILILAIVALSFIMYYGWEEEYEIGGIKIKKSTLNTLSDAVESDYFILCDIDKDKCITLGKIK